MYHLSSDAPPSNYCACNKSAALPPPAQGPLKSRLIPVADCYSQHLSPSSVKFKHDHPKINEPYPPHYIYLFSGVLGLPLGRCACSSVHIYNSGFLLAA